MKITITIPDTEEFDKKEQKLLAKSFKTICDNLGVNGVECDIDYKETHQELLIEEIFGGGITYGNVGMKHSEEEEHFELKKGDKLYIKRGNLE